MDKDIIYIGLEFLFGPIQKFERNENGDLITGIKVIDDDSIIQNLDKDINDLWCDLWSNNPNETNGMSFDEKREKELAPKLLDMLTQLINRLNEVNDGSFEVEDMITSHLKKLINDK